MQNTKARRDPDPDQMGTVPFCYPRPVLHTHGQRLPPHSSAAEAGTLKDSLDLEAWHHTRTGFTEDHKEAAKAFVDKREPIFRGR